MSLSLSVQCYQAPLAERVRNAQSEWRTRRGAVLTLETPDGLVGRGEAAPLPGHSREPFEPAHAELQAVDVAALDRLFELGCESPAALAEELSQRALPATSAARFALETALLELVARRRAEPLHRLLRAAYGLPPAPDAPVPVAGLLDPQTALVRGAELLASGFSTLKLKVGLESAAEEVARVAALRAQLGASFELRLDANRAWSAAEARTRLEAFAPHRIEFIEEPTQPGQWLTAPAVAIALDESLPEALDLPASELAARGVRACVIKPTLQGGLTRALGLARAARLSGLWVVISHAFEGPIAFAALTELSLALGSSIAQGLGPHAALGAWQCPLPAGHGTSKLGVHDQPGLGLPLVLAVPGVP